MGSRSLFDKSGGVVAYWARLARESFESRPKKSSVLPEIVARAEFSAQNADFRPVHENQLAPEKDSYLRMQPPEYASRTVMTIRQRNDAV